MAAESSGAVKCFLDSLTSKLNVKGLSVTIDKCVVIPAALSNTTVQESEFLGMKLVNDGNFKLLGAAVGDTSFCMGHVRKRMNNAAKLLQATPQMSSKQAGLLVTRHCGSICKLSHAARVTQPAQIRDGLEEFSRLTKETLEHIMQSDLDDTRWALASMGSKDGGLGLRDGTKHASAVFCASFFNCPEYCIEIYLFLDISDASGFGGAFGCQDRTRRLSVG